MIKVECWVESKISDEFLKWKGRMPFDVMRERRWQLNRSNFASELLFMKLFKDEFNDVLLERNYPIANRFFADFFCFKRNLVIEIDGVSHNKTKEFDDKRDLFMSSLGYKVVRLNYKSVDSWKEQLSLAFENNPESIPVINFRAFRKRKRKGKRSIMKPSRQVIAFKAHIAEVLKFDFVKPDIKKPKTILRKSV